MTQLISVIIPTKNRAKLLCETLASLQAQTYLNWEALVVDDGSTDGTTEFVRSVAENDFRVYYLMRRYEPEGAPTCRNIGFEQSRGSYVIFLDSDDLLAPGCLAERLALIECNPKVQFVVSEGQLFKHQPGDLSEKWGEFTEENNFVRFLRGNGAWQTAGPLWRREAVEAIGGWTEGCLSWQDWEFHVRALATGMPYKTQSKCDHWIRRDETNRISQSRFDWRQIIDRIRMIAMVRDELERCCTLNTVERASLEYRIVDFVRECALWGGLTPVDAAKFIAECHRQKLVRWRHRLTFRASVLMMNSASSIFYSCGRSMAFRALPKSPSRLS